MPKQVLPEDQYPTDQQLQEIEDKFFTLAESLAIPQGTLVWALTVLLARFCVLMSKDEDHLSELQKELLRVFENEYKTIQNTGKPVR